MISIKHSVFLRNGRTIRKDEMYGYNAEKLDDILDSIKFANNMTIEEEMLRIGILELNTTIVLIDAEGKEYPYYVSSKVNIKNQFEHRWCEL